MPSEYCRFLLQLRLPNCQVAYASNTIEVLGARISLTRLAATLLAVVIVVGLYQFLMRTRTGRAIRAVAEDGDGARAVGINIDRIYMTALGISTACVCIAGAMMTPFSTSHRPLGFRSRLRLLSWSFSAAGQPEGRFVRRFIIGVVESFGEILMPEAALKQVATFTIFTLIFCSGQTGCLAQN